MATIHIAPFSSPLPNFGGRAAPAQSKVFQMLAIGVRFSLHAGKGNVTRALFIKWKFIAKKNFQGLQMAQFEFPMVTHPLASLTFGIHGRTRESLPLHAETRFCLPVTEKWKCKCGRMVTAPWQQWTNANTQINIGVKFFRMSMFLCIMF